MKWFHKIISSSREALEANGRARALSSLRQLNYDLLRSYGYSPEKMALGVGAWPWRNEAGTVAELATVTAADTAAASVARPANVASQLDHAA
jgi:hypothetical protein